VLPRAGEGAANGLCGVAFSASFEDSVVSALDSHDEGVTTSGPHRAEQLIIYEVRSRECGPREVPASFELLAELERSLAAHAEGLIGDEEFVCPRRAQDVDFFEDIFNRPSGVTKRADDTKGARPRTAIVREHGREGVLPREGEAIAA
jgi:hypothetical protein